MQLLVSFKLASSGNMFLENRRREVKYDLSRVAILPIFSKSVLFLK